MIVTLHPKQAVQVFYDIATEKIVEGDGTLIAHLGSDIGYVPNTICQRWSVQLGNRVVNRFIRVMTPCVNKGAPPVPDSKPLMPPLPPMPK